MRGQIKTNGHETSPGGAGASLTGRRRRSPVELGAGAGAKMQIIKKHMCGKNENNRDNLNTLKVSAAVSRQHRLGWF